MKRSLYLGAALLTVSHSLLAAPVVLTGKTVRFILDDTQLTAFGGTKPTVQNDTLIFSAPAATYKAEALAPSKPVGFKEQYIEFNIEALGGQSLTSVTLNTSGLRTIQGKAALTNALAFGKLNVKDRQLVNRSLDFEAVDASASSWQGLNISTEPKGTQATLGGINSRMLAVSASHSIRALALDKTGNATNDAQDGVSFTATTTAATKPDRLFDWAESLLPGLGAGSPTYSLVGSSKLQCNKAGEACIDLDGMLYRCYQAAKLCYGVKDDIAYLYEFKDQIVRNVGSTQLYFNQAVKSGF